MSSTDPTFPSFDDFTNIENIDFLDIDLNAPLSSLAADFPSPGATGNDPLAFPPPSYYNTNPTLAPFPATSTSPQPIALPSLSQFALTPAPAAAAAAPPADDPSRHAADEDKRRRNTAASARFRVKKKQREAALEKTAREMTERVGALEARIEQLEMENKWLKGLISTDTKESEEARARNEGEEIQA